MKAVLALVVLAPPSLAVRRTVRWAVRGLATELGVNLLGGRNDIMPAHELAPALSGAAIVTGATGGIGEPLCTMLSERGYMVIVAARDEERGRALAERLCSQGGKARFVPLQLSTGAASASTFTSALKEAGVRRVSLLINCAGSMGGSCSETLTVNLIAPAALSVMLMPLLLASKRPRVVNVGSSSHLRAAIVDRALLTDPRRDRSLQAYGQSKLGLMQVSRVLRAQTPALCVHDCHPGIVWTPMLRRQFGPIAVLLRRAGLERRLFKTPQRGAQMVLAAALGAPHHPVQGAPAYWVEGKLSPALASPESCSERAAQEMWAGTIAPALESEGIPASL